MDDIKTKLREVYLPFLLVAIGTILFYNLFRWTFDNKLGMLPLKADLLNFWIPFFFPWVPVSIWLKRRVRVLNVNRKRDNGYFFYQFAMVVAIAAPTMISQNYIEKGLYELQELADVKEVIGYENEKYFDIDWFRVDEDASLPYITARTTGKNNDNLNFYLYMSCPFNEVPNVWYGVEFKKRISNLISQDKKEAEYRSFIINSEQEFKRYKFQRVRYFEKLGYSDARDGFLEAIEQASPSVDKQEQIILVPHKEDFEQRLGNTFPWIFGSFGIGAFVIFLMVAIPKINKGGLRALQKDTPLGDDDLTFVMEFFDPRGPHKVTAILLLLNALVFVVMIISGANFMSPTPQELLEIGGNRRPEVMAGEYWRLLTAVFIHGGAMHLLMNLFGLWLGASLLEEVLGRTKLFVSYIVCGILASIASIYWHENTVSVGASGAIFGLYGVILAFTIFKIYPDYTRGNNWVLLGLYAGVSLLFGFMGGIDNAAHFGGLISGFLIGWVLVLAEREELTRKAGKY